MCSALTIRGKRPAALLRCSTPLEINSLVRSGVFQTANGHRARRLNRRFLMYFFNASFCRPSIPGFTPRRLFIRPGQSRGLIDHFLPVLWSLLVIGSSVREGKVSARNHSRPVPHPDPEGRRCTNHALPDRRYGKDYLRSRKSGKRLRRPILFKISPCRVVIS